MKSKLFALITVVMLCLMSFVGCAETASYSVSVTHDGSEILSAAENVEESLKALQIAGQSLFKEVKIEENKGIFYTSYKFTAKTNVIIMPEDEPDTEPEVQNEAQAEETAPDTSDDTADTENLTVKLNVPGNVTQVKNGNAEDNTVTFTLDLSQKNDIAVFSDANNYAVVIGIVLVLIVIAVAAFFLTRNRE